MSKRMNRRRMLGWTTAAVVAANTEPDRLASARAAEQKSSTSMIARKSAQRKMKLGMVTYNLARNWDLPTIIKRCKATGIEAVEFRTTHKHGLEPTLSKTQRLEVKKQCADGGLVIWGLGTTCEYHSPDPAVVAKNIEETKKFIELAHDIGAKGVKVRPNQISKEADLEKTIAQIGRSLRTCGQAAADAGVEIWCEVHGAGSAHPPYMRKMMDIADRDNVGVTWNSNKTDLKNGSVAEYFNLLRPKIYSVHINELISGYPYRELFSLLNETGYDRYTLIEAAGLNTDDDQDIIRFIQYYKALWEELSRPA